MDLPESFQMAPHHPFADSHHDLYIRTGDAGFYFRNANHGVTLEAERMTWSFEGRTDSAHYRDISSVHLQSGGSWQNPISMCRITFADGRSLIVTNADASGLADDAQRPLYRDFVHDLHARLAALPHAQIAFTTGLQGFRYPLIIACGTALGIICIGVPVIAAIRLREFGPLTLLFAGVGLYWPLVKMIETNTPGSYDPRHPPAGLLG